MCFWGWDFFCHFVGRMDGAAPRTSTTAEAAAGALSLPTTFRLFNIFVHVTSPWARAKLMSTVFPFIRRVVKSCKTRSEWHFWIRKYCEQKRPPWMSFDCKQSGKQPAFWISLPTTDDSAMSNLLQAFWMLEWRVHLQCVTTSHEHVNNGIGKASTRSLSEEWIFYVPWASRDEERLLINSKNYL